MKKMSHFVCQSCGTVHAKWAGKCDGCGAWDTLVEETAITAPKSIATRKSTSGLALTALTARDTPLPERLMTGISELDRVLGGGLVAGSAILIGGDPGIGKSTLLLQAVGTIAALGNPVIYVSGEESVGQIQLRAERLGVTANQVSLAAANRVSDVLSVIDTPNPPALVIIDSIQTMFIDAIESAPGTVAQVRASAHALITAAKKRNVALILVGHVTKDGQIAGPRVVEHMVDTVLYFEGDRGLSYRILRAVKNRFGATDEIGVFQMNDRGLEEVLNPSSLFLTQREDAVSGAVVFAGMEGSRPLLVEVQALITPSGMSTPRRAVVGFDAARLSMILAVLEARGGARFSDKEVYLSIAGGLRIAEPAADLAAAAALLSALTDKAFPAQMVAFGEIGLTGEVRPVSRHDGRLKESEKLGFTRALAPPATAASSRQKPSAATVGSAVIAHVSDLVSFFG
jgi:DNA repair protein RadA/Sms